MIMDQLLLSALGLGLVFSATPGAVNTESLRRGVSQGFWPALLVQLGSPTGDLIWAAVALTGTAFFKTRWRHLCLRYQGTLGRSAARASSRWRSPRWWLRGRNL